ncbi:Microtubule-associated protein 70-4, partial [Cucurbita argyrosperma subsp. sororia]
MPLTISGSFTEGKSSSQWRTLVRPSMDANDFLNLFHGSDPVKVELNRLENEAEEKLKLTVSLLESKNLEIKKINGEKASMTAQFAAHATQKDDDMPPIEDILEPLEAEL